MWHFRHGFAATPSPHRTVTFGSSCTVIFDQVRKARVRIKILCQHNMGRASYRRHNKSSVKLNSDHRNSISRQCPPQARPSEFNFTAAARRRRDHRNLTLRQHPPQARPSESHFPAGNVYKVRYIFRTLWVYNTYCMFIFAGIAANDTTERKKLCPTRKKP